MKTILIPVKEKQHIEVSLQLKELSIIDFKWPGNGQIFQMEGISETPEFEIKEKAEDCIHFWKNFDVFPI